MKELDGGDHSVIKFRAGNAGMGTPVSYGRAHPQPVSDAIKLSLQ